MTDIGRRGRTSERSIREATQRKELDRIQWAGLDKIDYLFQFTCQIYATSFEVRCNFEGRVLKGYSNVYPVPPYEGPGDTVGYLPSEAKNNVLLEVWFGRAFEAPPFFTFSTVKLKYDPSLWTPVGDLTLGVAEWRTDEQGIYLGAILWLTANCGTVGG